LHQLGETGRGGTRHITLPIFIHELLLKYQITSKTSITALHDVAPPMSINTYQRTDTLKPTSFPSALAAEMKYLIDFVIAVSFDAQLQYPW
jgi:hypothetical protein